MKIQAEITEQGTIKITLPPTKDGRQTVIEKTLAANELNTLRQLIAEEAGDELQIWGEGKNQSFVKKTSDGGVEIGVPTVQMRRTGDVG